MEINWYLLIFEIWKVKATLSSTGQSSQVKKFQRILTVKRISLIAQIVISLIAFIIYIHRETTINKWDIYEWIYQGFKVLRLGINMVVIIIFTTCMRFFIYHKKIALQQKYKIFNTWNYLVIIWIMLVVIANIMNQMVKCFSYAIENILFVDSDDDPYTIQFYFNVCSSFLNQISIIYLIYTLGNFENNRSNDNSSA